MPAIFGDHMVLQQGMSLPVWGEADPDEQVTVTFVGQSVTTRASDQGKWRVNLKPVYLRSSPDVLTVEGKNRLQFSDVLVGDVWLCSGQSNMAFPLIDSDRGESEIFHAKDPELRFFVVKEKTAFQPQQTIVGEWQRCTLESAATFSAIGYFFGRDLRKKTQMPIGLIGSYQGGTSAQTWISLAALQEAPSFSNYLAEYATVNRNLAEASASYPQRQQAYETALATWKKEIEIPYNKELTTWKIRCDEERFKLRAQPLKPEPSESKPQPPLPPDGGFNLPSVHFNAMIAPLIPYAITGVIWYQGESNQGVYALEYRRLFQRLIRSWRAAWGEGPFPFYFVGLAGYYKESLEPVESIINEEGCFNPEKGIETGDLSQYTWPQKVFFKVLRTVKVCYNFAKIILKQIPYEISSSSNSAFKINPSWAWVREGQATALTLPETGMVVATDLGDPDDIHPADKLDIGRRLALLARKNVYGERQLVASGPVYRSMKREGKKIRLMFDSIGKGLVIGVPPWSYNDSVAAPVELKGFALAGPDRLWEEATARIEGDSIVVSNDHIDHPEAVRYNWKNNPSGNLYNKEGLPAAPFRTDADQPK
ncbi:MAG TPA: sialate O-acetylesterase [Chthoniobacterales bacterium]|nr:sialate O-acetylesterase [Chthoniobacterales bacterium]